MRIVLAVVFGLVAVAAAAMWLLGTTGPSPNETAMSESAMESASAPAIEVASSPAAEDPVAAAPAPAVEPDPGAERRTRSLSTEPPVEMAEAPPMDDALAAADGVVAPAVSSALEPEPAASTMADPAPVASAPTLQEQFKSRQVSYNRPPSTLTLNHPIDVSLVINATGDEDAGREALEGFPGAVVERDVELSDSVSAQLTGVGFDITTQTVVRQKLSDRTINRWQWRVTPTEPGTRTLILEIFGYTSGSDDAEPLDAYRDEIRVEVQQVERLVGLASEYQPLFAAIAGLAGLISAFFAFMRFREERKRSAGG